MDTGFKAGQSDSKPPFSTPPPQHRTTAKGKGAWDQKNRGAHQGKFVKREGWGQRLSSTTGPRDHCVGCDGWRGRSGRRAGGLRCQPGLCNLPRAISREPGKDAQGSSGNHTWGRKWGQWHFLWLELACGENTGHDGEQDSSLKGAEAQGLVGESGARRRVPSPSASLNLKQPPRHSWSHSQILFPGTRCQLSLPIKPQPQDTKSNDTHQQQEAARPRAGIYEPDEQEGSPPAPHS